MLDLLQKLAIHFSNVFDIKFLVKDDKYISSEELKTCPNLSGAELKISISSYRQDELYVNIAYFISDVQCLYIYNRFLMSSSVEDFSFLNEKLINKIINVISNPLQYLTSIVVETLSIYSNGLNQLQVEFDDLISKDGDLSNAGYIITNNINFDTINSLIRDMENIKSFMKKTA